MAAVRHAEYVNYCHQCARAVSSGRAGRCDGCGWLRCRCGACGCNYDGQLRLSELAMVPPVWSRLLAQPVAGPPRPARLPRAVPLITLLAVVAILGALALDGYLTVPALDLPAPPELQLPALPELHFAWPWPARESAAGNAPGTEPLLGGTGALAALQRGPLDPLAPAATVPGTIASTANGSTATGAASTVLYVANTAGQGAYIRSQPREGADTRITAWAEGTAMTTLETRALPDAEGATVWVRVRDPRGTEGWLRQAYLAPTP